MPMEKTEKYLRFRQTDPDKYSKMRTKTLSKKEGIKAVIGKVGKNKPMEVQSVLFDKDKWTKDRAVEWLNQHEQFHASINWTKVILGGLGLLYVISPIDFIPDFIPGIGWIDDAVIGVFSIGLLSDGLGVGESD